MSVPPSPEVTIGTTAAPSEEAMLAELGYKQELHRGMSGFATSAPDEPRLPPRHVEPRPMERPHRVGGGHLGRFHRHPLHAAAGEPITVNTFNYAPIAVVAVLVFSTVTWFVGGRLHFMRDVPKGHDTKPATEIFG